MYLVKLPGIKTMCTSKMDKQIISLFWISMLEINFQGGITEHKAPFAHEHAEINELEDIVKELKYDNDDYSDDDDDDECMYFLLDLLDVKYTE